MQLHHGANPLGLKLRCRLPITADGRTLRERRVPDPMDWKQKHLDALREMEHKERSWHEIEQLLRRLVTRLCAVARGADAPLNAQLDRISAAARREADAAELQGLFDALTGAIMAAERAAAPAAVRAVPPPAAPRAPSQVAATPAAEAPSPVRTGLRWESSCAAVAGMLERLGGAGALPPDWSQLRGDLAAVQDDAALAQILTRVADLAVEQCASIERERGEVVAMLGQVTKRLDEMAGYLASASAERERGHQDEQSLNTDMLAQMTSLTAEVRASEDLPALRTLVSARLEAVAVKVRDFHERAHQRYQEHAVRSERMHTRIADLERESTQLQRNLDLEKQRSRSDPVTGVANRVSFEERFAAELARWQQAREPVAVLVWDIDHFKAINDACGHRAGDTVLREVAGCLSRGRREMDFFARIGGEEFVTLLLGTKLPDAARAAEQMRSSVAALKFHFRRSPVHVTVSCGLTELRDGDSVDSVFDRADAALYQAKNTGRNVCVVV